MMLHTDETIRTALTEADPDLGQIIQAMGPLEVRLADDAFTALADAIVAQQLSGKVAEVLWGRLVALAGPRVTPDAIMALSAESLRNIGLSGSKVSYLRSLAEAVLSGKIDPEALPGCSDADIIDVLVSVKGIGRWTAEMFLIFALGRPDVFSAGDGGLQRAVTRLRGADRPLSRDELLAVSERWRPYRTFACLYLWRSLAIPPPNG